MSEDRNPKDRNQREALRIIKAVRHAGEEAGTTFQIEGDTLEEHKSVGIVGELLIVVVLAVLIALFCVGGYVAGWLSYDDPRNMDVVLEAMNGGVP